MQSTLQLTYSEVPRKSGEKCGNFPHIADTDLDRRLFKAATKSQL